MQEINSRVAIYPKPGDEHFISNELSGTDHDIPCLNLDLYGRVHLAFHGEADDAVVFLDTLADEATSLATKIRTRQRGLNNLLAAVEAAPGGEG